MRIRGQHARKCYWFLISRNRLRVSIPHRCAQIEFWKCIDNRENWNELINIRRGPLISSAATLPARQNPLSRWQLPRVLHLIWQTTADLSRNRFSSAHSMNYYPRKVFFHLAPRESRAFQFSTLPPPTIPPTFPRNWKGRKGALRARFSASGWNRFLQAFSKETFSRGHWIEGDADSSRVFWKLGRNFVFFLMEKKLRSISLRKERKGIKKGIFSLKKSAIYTGGGEF